MAFLDNSGDIILDAVLTDTGRYRLAKGDGSFKITKFALGDDEIDYALYDRNNASGSAYYDLSILQTPILEAFTDNAASLKSKLISIPRTNLLYLPVMKINDLTTSTKKHAPTDAFLVAVDNETETQVIVDGVSGILKGEGFTTSGTPNYIRVDQGLDTTEISPSVTIDSDLTETQYIIEMDNRLGKLISTTGNMAKVSFIDDDNMASYYLSLNTDGSFVVDNTNTNNNDQSTEVIAGPKGTMLMFGIASSLELNTSDFLFEQLGGATTLDPSDPASTAINKIDTIVRITGATTGYRLDIPVRFIKLV